METNSEYDVKMKTLRKIDWDGAVMVLDASNLSGQNYQLISRPIFVDGRELTDHFATVRADTGRVLGIVSDQHKTI